VTRGQGDMVMRRGDTESSHFQAPPPNSHSQAEPGNAIKEAPPPNIYIFLYTMGRSRYHFLESQPHFLTCTVVNWIAIFSKPDLVEIVLNSLEFLQSQKRLALHSYVIMENHLH
jgi:hypothetical protein